jgi:hypothetical protein
LAWEARSPDASIWRQTPQSGDKRLICGSSSGCSGAPLDQKAWVKNSLSGASMWRPQQEWPMWFPGVELFNIDHTNVVQVMTPHCRSLNPRSHSLILVGQSCCASLPWQHRYMPIAQYQDTLYELSSQVFNEISHIGIKPFRASKKCLSFTIVSEISEFSCQNVHFSRITCMTRIRLLLALTFRGEMG